MNKPILFILCLCLLLSCNEGGEIGLNFFDDNAFEVSSLDTLSLEVSTVITDSIDTQNRGTVLVGRHVDAKLGVILAKGYFRLGNTLDSNPFNAASDIQEDVTFDSLTLHLDYSGYSVYDTNTTQHIAIHLTTEEIEADDDFFIYNTTSFPYESQAIGTLTFIPSPTKDDELEVRLPDHMGIDMLNHLIDDELTDYINDFKGLVLVPDQTDNSAILGIANTSSIQIHYHVKNELDPEGDSYTIPLDGTHYTEMSSDRSQTYLSNLTEQRYDLSSEQTEYEGYIQGGIGLGLRVEIPHLTKLRDAENLILSKAYLEFKPTAEQDENNVALPIQLDLFEVNHRNKRITYFGNEFTTLTVDEELDRGTSYTTDITAFVDKQLEEASFNENALLFEIGSYQSGFSLDRLYIGDAYAARNMKLLIYYVKVK